MATNVQKETTKTDENKDNAKKSKCPCYEDTESGKKIKNRLEELDKRISELEQICAASDLKASCIIGAYEIFEDQIFNKGGFCKHIATHALYLKYYNKTWGDARWANAYYKRGKQTHYNDRNLYSPVTKWRSPDSLFYYFDCYVDHDQCLLDAARGPKFRNFLRKSITSSANEAIKASRDYPGIHYPIKYGDENRLRNVINGHKERELGISDFFELERLKKEQETLKKLEKTQRADIEKACEELMKEKGKTSSKDTNYSISTYSSGKTVMSLFDLRNVNNKNFRGNENSLNKQNSMINDPTLRAHFDLETNRQTSFSKTFNLNKDFLINDTLTLYKDIGINEGTKVLGMSSGLITQPLIQKLILNEFQPYDMISPADIIPGFADAGVKFAQQGAAMIGGNAVVVLGKTMLSKSAIDRYSKDPSEIYSKGAKTRERKYFSSDPIQVIQNMFNGGKWLNTYELPYYGKEYLNGKHTSEWEVGDSGSFLGALAGTDEPGSIGTKRIWN